MGGSCKGTKSTAAGSSGAERVAERGDRVERAAPAPPEARLPRLRHAPDTAEELAAERRDVRASRERELAAAGVEEGAHVVEERARRDDGRVVAPHPQERGAGLAGSAGQPSHASPTPSPSASAWSFGTLSQLSATSQRASPSPSAQALAQLRRTTSSYSPSTAPGRCVTRTKYVP